MKLEREDLKKSVNVTEPFGDDFPKALLPWMNEVQIIADDAYATATFPQQQQQFTERSILVTPPYNQDA